MKLGDFIASKEFYKSGEEHLTLIQKNKNTIHALNTHLVHVTGELGAEKVEYRFPGHVVPCTVSVCVIEIWGDYFEQQHAVIVLRFPLYGTMQVERSTRCVVQADYSKPV